MWLRQTEEEGIITAFLSKTIYEVEVGQVRFPVFADQLEHPYLRRFQKSGVLQAKKAEELPPPEKKKVPRLPQGCYLSFLPVYKETEHAQGEIGFVKVHLVNELPDMLRFEYTVRAANRAVLFHLAGSITEYANVYLHTVPWEVMAAQPRFGWSLQPTCEGRVGPRQSGTVSLRPRQLLNRLYLLEQSGNPTFSELLVDQFVETPLLSLPQLKGSGVVDQIPAVKPFSETIDLHANALLPDAEDYLPTDIFRVQLDALTHFIEAALVHQARRLWVVHGVGNGLLRRAVAEILQSFPEVHQVLHEWHPRFGFGATEVRLKYKAKL